MGKNTPYIFVLIIALYAFLFFIGTQKSLAVGEVEYEQIVEVSPEANIVSQVQPQAGNDDQYALDASLQVQAVLSSGQGLLISAPIDGMLKKVPFENGDTFKKGTTLISYDCTAERAKVDEIRARLSISDRQLQAYKRLKEMDLVSEVEYVSVVGERKQDRALLTQAQSRLNMCVIKAPFDGRVQDLQVDDNEVVKSGRFLMKINSNAPLNVEMLVPSIWLRWLNVGTNLEVYIKESDRLYDAKVIRIHGEVDPVSQSIRVVAKIDSYEEELLPGMSGKAIFENTPRHTNNGFMGLATSLNNGQ